MNKTDRLDNYFRDTKRWEKVIESVIPESDNACISDVSCSIRMYKSKFEKASPIPDPEEKVVRL